MNEDRIICKLEEHDEKFDTLMQKLLEHDQYFVLIHQDIAELRQDMMCGQDEMLTTLHRLDTESASRKIYDRASLKTL